MTSRTHQRIPALVLLGTVTLLAAGSFWLVQLSQQSALNTSSQTERTEPDYFVENFTYSKVDGKGRVEYVIEGVKMTHYPVDKHSVIDKPVVRNFSPDRPPTTVRAETANINGDHTEVKLIDNVILERAQTRGDEPLTVTSEYMLVLPKKDVVTTDRHVDIRVGNTRLSGTGMVANNATRQLTLESRVNGIYPPPNKP
jgi:lipopolysaccharide export system protein LptC